MKLKILFISTAFLLFSNSILQGQVITTIAGSGIRGFSGSGGPATSAQTGETFGVAVDNSGNVFWADEDDNVVWKINSAGIISIYAGSGVLGYTGDGGPASAAQLYHPLWISIDNAGNLYIVDQNGDYIRKVDAAGIISTFAYTSYSNVGTGDGGPVSAAKFVNFAAAVPDNAGNVYISDYGAHTIRKVNSAGIVSTIAGTGTAGFSGDGGPATAAQLNHPYGVVIDNAGNIIIPDPGNERVRKINSAGIISTIAGNGSIGYTGDGGPANSATFNFPWEVTADGAGNIYVADPGNCVIRKIDNAGIITTYAGNGTYGYSGDGGPAIAAQLTTPSGITVDNAGNLYITDEFNFALRKVNNCLTAVLGQQPADASICAGQNTSFTVTATNTTGFQWMVNNGSGWANINDDAIYSGSGSSTLTITSATSLMNNSQYRCSVINSCGYIYSQLVTLKVNAITAPSVSVTSSAATICAGAPVTFTATPMNGGTAPVYQWQLNGTNVGTNNPVYSNNALVNGDIVNCLLTSNSTCKTSPTAVSNNLSITVNSSVTPTVTISTPATTICSGTNVTFTASPSGGGSSPSYQWEFNGNPVGTNSNIYSSSTLTTGEIISCIMTSNATCVTSSTAVSNNISLTVNAPITPSVNIVATANRVCAGTPVTFTASPVNGGTTPIYQWQLNYNNVGTNSPIYNNSNLADLDIVSCIITSNQACLTTSKGVSNNLIMAVDPLVAPTVSVTASPAAICAGTNVTFTATPTNEGISPTYQWQLNGSNIGTNSPTYSNSNLANGDIVSCIMTSNARCAVPTIASSNQVTEQVTAFVNSSVTINASATSICSGTDVSFTGVPTNGGNTPSYQWQVNGNNMGVTGNVFQTSNLKNGDIISCTMASSLTCTVPVSSLNNIIMTVNPNPELTLMHDTTIGLGQSVKINSIITGNIASYDWTPANGLDNSSVASPIASPLSTTTYQLIVYSDKGCTATGKVTIGIFRYLAMPNAFTPNGNGKNDVFRIPPSLSVKIRSFTVYNRWGERVFLTKDSSKGWDGTIGGKLQPTGTYVWQIEYEDVLTGKPITVGGTVILIR